MPYQLKYSKYNERSILVEWPAVIDEKTLKSILNYKNKIQNYFIKQNIEVISAYNSLLIIYELTIDNFYDKKAKLKSLFEENFNLENLSTRVWEIPVCYDREFGVDLEDISKSNGLSITEIINLHTQQLYTIYFMGFLPGFLYLGGLDHRLRIDRKSTPNLNVKQGSVAIGGHQTGIYPQDSPGGWYVIGKTPIELIDVNQNPPSAFKAGDRLRFKSIDKQEFLSIAAQVANSSYQLKPVK